MHITNLPAQAAPATDMHDRLLQLLKRMNIHLILPLLMLFTLSLSADTVSCSLLQVEDGDTLVIDLNGTPTRVQLLGIDAPEDIANPKLMGDTGRTGIGADLLLELGRLATSHLRQLISPATKVNVEGDLKRSDKYGRIPVIVSLPGEEHSLNAAMVRQGYAITLNAPLIADGVPAELLQLEEQARREPTGLWKSKPELMQAWSGRSASTR